jgi:hypothetical protein
MTMSNLFEIPLSKFGRPSWLTIGSLGFAALAGMVANPAHASSLVNGSFESGFTGWSTIGDVSTTGVFNVISPTEGSNQALLTTANTTLFDDIIGAPGAYNYSGISAADARSNSPDLQTFLGLSPTALNFTGAAPFNFPHDSKEGSAIKQSITLHTESTISFNWSFLTNDGAPLFPGDPRDTAFVTLYSTNSDLASRTIEVLRQSEPVPPTGFYPTTPNGSTFQLAEGIFTFNSGLLAAGEYHLGIGVYDVDGTDKTSALLVDNVRITPAVPATPEPLSILGTVLAVGIGLQAKRRQNA